MSNNTEMGADSDTGSTGTDESPDEAEPRTSGHIQRTVLHAMAGDSYVPYRPATVGDVLEAVVAVIERGDYANAGPRADAGIARRSTIRRAFSQLHDAGFIQRVTDLSAAARASDRIDLGPRETDTDSITDFAYVSDDGRVTDWILTEAGEAEVRRLDAQYQADLDALAARYGRPRGETTTRIDG